MTFRILLTAENVAGMLKYEVKHVKRLTRLGIIPSLDIQGPAKYEFHQIEQWIADGKAEQHKPPEPEREYKHPKGVWLRKK